MPDLSEQRALTALAGLAAELTGFSAEAVRPEALRRVLRAQLTARSMADVAQAISQRESGLAAAVQQAVTVGETYFFRHPAQFELILRDLLPARDGDWPWRAWSAGCATGEEAYTLGACVRAARSAGLLPDSGGVPVLGTDLLERNIATARAAQYGRWSVRASGPELVPLLMPFDGDRVSVLDEVRGLVRFEQRNLLAPPPIEAGLFDLVLCRNVLVYFSPQAAARVLEHLASSLAPGGVLLLGAMDLLEPPRGLVRHGPAELFAFRRPDAAPLDEVIPKLPPPLPRQVAPPPIVHAPPAPLPVSLEPVALHLRALGMIEHGDDAGASSVLHGLCRDTPDYVAGMTEYAMLLARRGDLPSAAARMRDVLRLAARLPQETLLPGPEPLPAHYFVSSAETLLERLERSV